MFSVSRTTVMSIVKMCYCILPQFSCYVAFHPEANRALRQIHNDAQNGREEVCLAIQACHSASAAARQPIIWELFKFASNRHLDYLRWKNWAGGLALG